MHAALSIYEADYHAACAALAAELRDLDKYRLKDNANVARIAIIEERMIERKLFLDRTASIVQLLKEQANDQYLLGYDHGKKDGEAKYLPCTDGWNTEGMRAKNIAAKKELWDDHY
jgi:hypothetical protein